MNPIPNPPVNGRTSPETNLVPATAPTGQPFSSPTEGKGPGAGWTVVFTRWLSPQRKTFLLRLIVGGAFVLAGSLKIANPAKFAQDVGHYRLLPDAFINLVAVLIPWLELVAGVFVLAGIWLRAAALVISGLTVMFLFVICSALARGLNIECGCFGTVGGQDVGLVNLAVDAMLFFFAASLAGRARKGSANEFFSEAGTQDSAPPQKASPKASPVVRAGVTSISVQ